AEPAQGEHQLSVFLGDVGDLRLGGGGTEEGHGDQVVHRPGGLAVPVDELIHQVVRVLLAADGGDAPVQVHALLGRGDVPVGDGGGDGQVGGALGALGRRLALLGEDGLLQQLQIHVIAHR